MVPILPHGLIQGVMMENYLQPPELSPVFSIRFHSAPFCSMSIFHQVLLCFPDIHSHSWPKLTLQKDGGDVNLKKKKTFWRTMRHSDITIQLCNIQTSSTETICFTTPSQSGLLAYRYIDNKDASKYHLSSIGGQHTGHSFWQTWTWPP